MGPHPGSDINKSNPQWLRSHPFRTRGLPGEGALRKPDIVISRGILLFKTRTDGGEGSKTPIFAGRPRWMAPSYQYHKTDLKQSMSAYENILKAR